MDVVLLVIYLLIALVFSFLCSVFEAVLLSVRRPYLLTQRKERPANAAVWEQLTADINRPLSAILILNTVAHTVGAAGVGGQAMKIFGSAPLTTGLISAVLTLLILILSEIIPKTLGAVFWKQLAPSTGRALQGLTKLMSPLIWLTNKITSGISHGEKKGAFSRSEFLAMADVGAQEGSIEEAEGRIMKNLFSLRDTEARNAATPRSVIFSLPQNLTVGEFMEKHADKPFSRIPVFEKGLDDCNGFVLRFEIVHAQASGQSEKTLSEFKRPIHAVRETQNLSALFQDLMANRFHIATLLDEFGSISGIITLEDVIETLLGEEIVDEVDSTVDMQQMARDLWRKRAEKMGLQADEFSAESADESKAGPGVS